MQYLPSIPAISLNHCTVKTSMSSLKLPKELDYCIKNIVFLYLLFKDTFEKAFDPVSCFYQLASAPGIYCSPPALPNYSKPQPCDDKVRS